MSEKYRHLSKKDLEVSEQLGGFVAEDYQDEEDLLHYSDKGGHFLRGLANKEPNLLPEELVDITSIPSAK